MNNALPVALALAAAALGPLVSMGALFPPPRPSWLRYGSLLTTSSMSLLWLVSAYLALQGPGHSPTLRIGTRILWQFRLDPLSAFFLLILGVVGVAASLHALGYFRSLGKAELQRVLIPLPVFLSAMALVLLADNAYSFLVAWEAMALSSSFLILVQSQAPTARRAAYLYLLIAHLGALCLLAAFALLSNGNPLSGNDFSAMAQRIHTPWQTQVIYLLTLLGFGAKLGAAPLHIWLPEAHPAAPSPVSALMSAAMLPIALYGLLRIDWVILPPSGISWGLIWLAVGLLTAGFGVLFSTLQRDLKRLLAYSSMENMGLILVALGLARLFAAANAPTLAALALTAGLLQTLNHAFFKGLLFLGSGSVFHSAGTVDMGRLGGLIRVMPQTTLLMLIGTLAIAGLPPLNGFASEWMLLQAFLLAPQMASGALQAILPLAAAGVVLVLALSSFAIVKAFGLSFLGQVRSSYRAHEASLWERLAMAFLALGCILLGLFPGFAVNALQQVNLLLLHTSGLGRQSCWGLTPISPERASYLPSAFLIGIVLATVLTFLLVWWRFGRPFRRVPVWACGFRGPITPRMQDSPTGFSQPLLRIFQPVHRGIILPQSADRELQVEVVDPFWSGLYQPVQRLANALSRQALRLQRGRITSYLLYAFLTLVILLVLVR
ncbi:proton-conducting transporter membrane subunit [Candidatus Igneacidithiobacillus taiwanensis]|uniref:proton-conducting transporter transmembrane domain-containing protein n=1 Tax=Candidatus Igneacidithiobacillus taiwanensis TaxID=1945924 RepID=UPI00289CB4B0|nr:proton-conducting transporter membrane subunit [Candidatus Igneacidithiobacillus taiwanensis]